MKLCLFLIFNLIAYFAFANGKSIQDEENFENGWLLLRKNFVEIIKTIVLKLTTKHVV